MTDLVVILAGFAIVALAVIVPRVIARRRRRAREKRRAEAQAFLDENARQLALSPLTFTVNDDGDIISEPRA